MQTMSLLRKFSKRKKQKKEQDAASAAAAANIVPTQQDGETHLTRATSSMSDPTKMTTCQEADDGNSAASDESRDSAFSSQVQLLQTSPYASRPAAYLPQNPRMQTNAYDSTLQRKMSLPAMPASQQHQSALSALNDYVPMAKKPHMLPTQTSSSWENIPKKHQTRIGLPAEDPRKAELVSYAVSFGLGRGIDATSKTPWKSKSAFQVRRVRSSIVETTEAGVLESYEHEVFSAADMEDKLRASMDPPETPLTICVESETARSLHMCVRRVVGRRVVNRTLAFQTDYEERSSTYNNLHRLKESFLLPKDPAEIVFNTQSSHLSFEDRVCEWLCHRIAVRKYQADGQKIDLTDTESPTEQLAKLLHTKAVQGAEEELREGCKELIRCLRITHYVSSIKLGAAQYCVMGDEEYRKKISTVGAFGLDKLVASVTPSPKTSKKSSSMRKIGFINANGRVEHNSQHETVLSITVLPITRLIRLPVVKTALQSAMESYMETTSNPEVAGGPFVIKCAGKDLYLTVNRFNNYEVEGTELPAEASLFYFLPTDNGGDPFYFHIAYYNEDIGTSEEEPSSEPVCRYLEAPIDLKGTHKHTLYMKHSVKARYCRFALRSRLAKKHTRSSLGSWVSSDNALYIACATKKFLHGSYVGLMYSQKPSAVLGTHFYSTACFPSIHQHNGENTFLLFQLLPKNRLSTSSLGEGIDDSTTPKAVTPLPSTHGQSTPVAGKENATPQKQ